MRPLRPVGYEPLFSFPITTIPESFWITDCALIVIHRSGLLKALPVRLGHPIGNETPAAAQSELSMQLARAHSEALQGTCTTIGASIHRANATIFVSPVRNAEGVIVGTIGRVETIDEGYFTGASTLSVNIVRADSSLLSGPDLAAIAEALLNSDAYGVCVFDNEGRVTRWSAAMEVLTGILASLCSGSQIGEVLPGVFELVPDVHERLSKGERLRLRRMPFSFGEVQNRYFDVSLTPVNGRSHSPEGALMIISDTTSEAPDCEPYQSPPVQHEVAKSTEASPYSTRRYRTKTSSSLEAAGVTLEQT